MSGTIPHSRIGCTRNTPLVDETVRSSQCWVVHKPLLVTERFTPDAVIEA
jgi:hypothetical protein